ncbi:methionyl-tRNA formyltransferase [Roseivirga echinicomitans]|uniref:Methionyl-tRNA formyltransferase n=1 Tax=Roseivirga echinicomitans TaxID=296218 RepID=A0A150XR12_9BACT|nr:formyltransferase family protein [Roseivirga echinicomitans]KYG81134.1 hypothetical protein AWN68_16480 [Roseivirga echinicomitans]
MKVALIGRTKVLLDTGKLLQSKGFEIAYIITSKEAPEYEVGSDDFKAFADELNCPFLHDPAISKDKILKLSTSNDVAIAISINYSGVISKEVTDLFPLGILNAHGGDLPRYRGNACQAWAIINGEKEIGLCIHRMIGDELDSGDILLKKLYPIDIDTRVGEVYQWFEKDIPRMFLKVAEKLKVEPQFVLEAQSKNSLMALRCYPRRPEDGKIDWHASAEEIVRLVNASSEPFEGAFCLDKEDAVLRIWRAAVFDDQENWCGIPGQIVQYLESGEIVLLTGQGKIKVSEIEYKGTRSVADTFFKSLRVRFY